MVCHIVPHFLMLWHSIRHLKKKIDYLDENCHSNRLIQNCDYLLIFCLFIPTAGQAITIIQVLLSTMAVMMVVVFVVVVLVVVVVVVVVVLVVGWW